MYQQFINVAGIPADPNVQAMYAGQQGGQGYGLGEAMRQLNIGPKASSAIKGMMGDRAGALAHMGLTDYNLARTPLSAQLYNTAIGAMGQNQLARLGLQRQIDATEYGVKMSGMQQLMQLLNPFLGSLMQV